MYGIIETPEKKHIHFFRIFYVLFSILIIVFLLYVLFMYVYNNSKITNTTPQTMHFAENFSLTSCKNTFNIIEKFYHIFLKKEICLLKNNIIK